MIALPIDEAMPEIISALAPGAVALIEAEPGAGKSTRIAPALTTAGVKRTWLLQPRRVAALGIARRIASEQGWQLGEQVGYAVRHEQRGNDSTSCWVATDGLLLRRLLSDPMLEDIDCVLFDEFHERSAASEILLGWLRYVQQELRPELRIGILSATLPGAELTQLIPEATRLDIPGRCFPVKTIHCPQPIQQANPGRRGAKRQRPEDYWATVAQRAFDENDGDVLVFLPGVGEINRVQGILTQELADDVATVAIVPLHGSLPLEQQAQVLRPSDTRRIILTTNIAETSLTVPGVRAVVDSTMQRHARVSPDTELSELALVPAAKSSLTQRAGRAGREHEGRCYRCCSKQDEARRPEFLPTELACGDLANWLPMIAQIHGSKILEFPWLEPINHERVEAALALLQRLGWIAPEAGEHELQLSPKARYLADIPLHPRLATLCLYAASQQALGLGCELAALLSERDIRLGDKSSSFSPSSSGQGDDLAERWYAWQQAERLGSDYARRHGLHAQSCQQVSRVVKQLRSACDQLGEVERHGTDPDRLIPQLALAAYPDRVAVRQDVRSNRLKMVGNVAVTLQAPSALELPRGRSGDRLMVVFDVQGLRQAGQSAGRKTVARGACPLEYDDLKEVTGWQGQWQQKYRYDPQRGKVITSSQLSYLDLTLEYREGGGASPSTSSQATSQLDAISTCLAAGLAQEGPKFWNEQEDCQRWIERCQWLQAHPACPPEVPNVDDSFLAEVLRTVCDGKQDRAVVLREELVHYLIAAFGYEHQAQLDQLAPDDIVPPQGRMRKIRYDKPGEPPRLAIKVQDCFGWEQTPTIMNGQQLITLELLAPNQRPAAITDNLERFWQEGWPLVRKDLRGRYPKHAWPENPQQA